MRQSCLPLCVGFTNLGSSYQNFLGSSRRCMSVCVGFTNSHIKKSLVEHKRAVAAVAWRVVHLSLVGTPRDNLVCQWVFDSPMWVVHIKTFLVAAAVAWRVGHVETIQTWGAAPCDYPPTYSAFNNSMYLSLNILYFRRRIYYTRVFHAANCQQQNSTRCVSNMLCHVHP